ncbi:MAG TPA: AI-2E family transporter [Streptosporangiaceae bacterium]|nr:AI-2E family transporter [Streptosporangiaceae bacterium]
MADTGLRDPGGDRRPGDDQIRPGDDQMQRAVDTAAAIADETGSLGRLGRPMNRRSPFFVGMMAAAGVAVTYGLVELLIRARSVLVLIGLALFIAAGLDPAVSWLTRRRLPRWSAVIVILLIVAGVAAGFMAAAIPPLTAQVTALIHELPHYLTTLRDHNSELGRLNTRFHVQERLSQLLSTRGTALVGGVLGAGELVLSAASSVLVVIVLVVYFLAAMPRIKLFFYRLAPQSRRARVILIGDEIFDKVGGYMLGNFLTSLIAGLGTWAWLEIFGVPYALLLGLLVALLDLIPVIGSTIGGAVVSLVALTVSLPVAIATLVFYIAYRLAEDYLIVPRVMGRAVQVPAVVTVLAVLVGGALMGLIGALVAIPAAAALSLLLHEVTFRRLDAS